MRKSMSTGVVAVMISTMACAHFNARSKKVKQVDPDTRLTVMQEAQVWAATDVPSMDLRAGPRGGGAFAPNATVACDYVEKKMNGSSPKFTCAITKHDEVKVKYGRDNGEVYAGVATTRLLWALGFGADRMYPVRVVCRGCPPTLQGTDHTPNGETVFDIAAIERKMPGREVDGSDGPGWAWSELDLVNPKMGGATRSQRDALKLLAVMIQHTDSKPEQQRLLCVDDKRATADRGSCGHAFMMIHDVGQTFGSANALNRTSVGSANLERWSHTPVWRDPAHCIGNLPKSWTGTLDNPPISEEGRRFLANLLVQLSDKQLRDLFEVARFRLRTQLQKNTAGGDTLEAWVRAFKQKVHEIADQTCPAGSESAAQ